MGLEECSSAAWAWSSTGQSAWWGASQSWLTSGPSQPSGLPCCSFSPMSSMLVFLPSVRKINCSSITLIQAMLVQRGYQSKGFWSIHVQMLITNSGLDRSFLKIRNQHSAYHFAQMNFKPGIIIPAPVLGWGHYERFEYGCCIAFSDPSLNSRTFVITALIAVFFLPICESNGGVWLT